MRDISKIADATFDVIIIGAGINGAGIARDAAMRGLRVLLLDKGDIACGTTSWSTRLIHGGLRYLEHGEIGLVRESLREREQLLRNAPHLVRPLPMLVPIYAGGARSRRAIRAGMLAYDLLSFDKSLARHQMLSPAEALRRAPGLNGEGLQGAAFFFDAQVEFAERLAVENILSAREHGATILTYARVERGLIEEGAVRGVGFVDLIDGGTYEARGAVVVNVAGPWVDEVVARVPCASPQLIGGTKGSHLVVGPFPGAPPCAVYAEAAADARPFFIIPWNGKYLTGTTDTRFAGELDEVAADEDEIDYLLRETNRVIPAAKLTRDLVLYTYSGVRPLAHRADGAPSGVTRRHFIHDHTPAAENFLSVVGGKLTTHRHLAEETVNLIFKKLRRAPPLTTAAASPLPGASRGDFAKFCAHFKAHSPLTPQSNEHLLRVYGARAAEVLELCDARPSLREVFDEGTGAIAAEVVFSWQSELAETLADCLLRRTMVGLNGALGLNAVAAAGRVAREHLGWDQTRVDKEITAYRRCVQRFRPRPSRTL